jgi:purine catabolism regulator
VGEAVRGDRPVVAGAALPARSFLLWKKLLALQGASAAALEWAKQNAVGIAEERMRATFLDELLAAEIADEQAWVQRGSSLGYNLVRRHTSPCWSKPAMWPVWPVLPLRFQQQRGAQYAPDARRDEGTLIFWPGRRSRKAGRSLKAVAHELVQRIVANNPHARALVGIGRWLGPANWRQSQMRAACVSSAAGQGVGELSGHLIWRPVAALPTAQRAGDSAEAARFYRKTLGRSIAYDDSRNAELVQTLDAFFAADGNLSQTAARLDISDPQYPDLIVWSRLPRHHTAGSGRRRCAGSRCSWP